LGFQTGAAALQQAPASNQQMRLRNEASKFLKRASKYWHSAPLITGRLLHPTDKEEHEKLARRAMDDGSPLARASQLLFELNDIGGLVDLCLTAAANFTGSKSAFKREEGDSIPSDMFTWEYDLYHRNTTNQRDSDIVGSGVEVTARDAMRTCHAILFHYLLDLLATNRHELVEQMLSICAGSKDSTFLEALYQHLIDKDHVDTLLRIDSEHLERWLKGKSKSSDREFELTLLWRFYILHHKDTAAGEIMWIRACDTSRKLALVQRIEFLRKALFSYNSFLGDNTTQLSLPISRVKTLSSSQGTVYPTREAVEHALSEVKAKLDVAQIQQRIARALKSIPSVSPDKMEVLESSLLSVSDLFNDYAVQWNLFDIGLAIMASCEYQDRDTTDMLWKSVICQELLPCATKSQVAFNFLQTLSKESILTESVTFCAPGRPLHDDMLLFESGTWVHRLKERVAQVGRELLGKKTDYMFPLDFIIMILEGLREALDVAAGSTSEAWPLNSVIEAGASYSSVLKCYADSATEEDTLIGRAGEAKRYVSLVV